MNINLPKDRKVVTRTGDPSDLGITRKKNFDFESRMKQKHISVPYNEKTTRSELIF